MPRPSYTRYPRPILWLIPGGELAIGGPDTAERSPEAAQVEPFYISKLPVTNQQLEASGLDHARSPLSPGDLDPAGGVSFELATAYAAWYAEVAHKPMRLPTELEWEYACRAGAPGCHDHGEGPATADHYIWHAGNSGDQLPKLEAKKANGFGLYGMLGGLWEWTCGAPRDGLKAKGQADDPVTPVLRGGSFRHTLEELSCSLRRGESRPDSLADVGFRIVKSFR